MKNMRLQVFSVLFLRAQKRHVAAAGTQHSNFSASAPFRGALLCNRAACALLYNLPAEQGLLTERLHPYSAVCAYCPRHAGIRFLSFIYLFIKAISAHSCHSGNGM